VPVPEATQLEVFISTEYPRLVGALTAQTGSRALAEDIAQEALARVCDRWDKVASMEQPRAWLYRTAMNLASSWFRRRAAERRALVRHGGGESRPDSTEATADALALRAALQRLPLKQRTALVYRYCLDLPVDEVAVLMGSTEAAVRQMTSRGAATLRGRLQPSPSGGPA
jgi:RNA polymerase sigma factor (sigma-70 family)